MNALPSWLTELPGLGPLFQGSVLFVLTKVVVLLGACAASVFLLRKFWGRGSTAESQLIKEGELEAVGDLRVRSNDLAGALEFYERASSWVKAGHTARRMGEHAKAAAFFEQGGEIKLALVSYEAAGNDEAVARLSAHTRDPSSLARAARWKQKHGKYVEAAELYRRAGMLNDAAKCDLHGNTPEGRQRVIEMYSSAFRERRSSGMMGKQTRDYAIKAVTLLLRAGDRERARELCEQAGLDPGIAGPERPGAAVDTEVPSVTTDDDAQGLDHEDQASDDEARASGDEDQVSDDEDQASDDEKQASDELYDGHYLESPLSSPNALLSAFEDTSEPEAADGAREPTGPASFEDSALDVPEVSGEAPSGDGPGVPDLETDHGEEPLAEEEGDQDSADVGKAGRVPLGRIALSNDGKSNRAHHRGVVAEFGVSGGPSDSRSSWDRDFAPPDLADQMTAQSYEPFPYDESSDSDEPDVQIMPSDESDLSVPIPKLDTRDLDPREDDPRHALDGASTGPTGGGESGRSSAPAGDTVAEALLSVLDRKAETSDDDAIRRNTPVLDQFQSGSPGRVSISTPGLESDEDRDSFGFSSDVTNRYAILERIGTGGMGEVYKARDLSLGRIVALKFLSPLMVGDDTAIRFFLREAQAAAALNHPVIVTVFDIGILDKRPFICMEYVHGTDLATRLTEDGALPVGHALNLTIQLAIALDFAHQRNVVHRDIKPPNVIETVDGVVKILDFGLAKAIEGDRKKSTLVAGTPEYMSPEQLAGLEVDGRTDIFSLGVLLYEILTNRTPFEGALRSPEFDPASVHAPWLPVGVDEVLARCLAIRPEDRFQTGREVMVALRKLAKGI
jgi:tetratricopeptide (TPR) repeat protein